MSNKNPLYLLTEFGMSDAYKLGLKDSYIEFQRVTFQRAMEDIKRFFDYIRRPISNSQLKRFAKTDNLSECSPRSIGSALRRHSLTRKQMEYLESIISGKFSTF